MGGVYKIDVWLILHRYYDKCSGYEKILLTIVMGVMNLVEKSVQLLPMDNFWNGVGNWYSDSWSSNKFTEK